MHFTQTRARYDTQVTIKNREIKCFSPKHLRKMLGSESPHVVGEITGGSAKNAIGQLQIGDDLYHVLPYKSKNRLLWRDAGYLEVGDEKYIAVLKSRVPFLMILTVLVAAVILLLCLLRGGTPVRPPSGISSERPGTSDPVVTPTEPSGPVVIEPDHPLPPVDENAEAVEDDDSEKADVSNGGGSVSMIYALDASIRLPDGEITIYFKNPNASSHSVIVDMYIVSGGQEYLIAQSGLLAPGFGLNKLQLMPAAPSLSEGIYSGLFRLHCYDPVTGEQAMVVPQIAGLNVTVTN